MSLFDSLGGIGSSLKGLFGNKDFTSSLGNFATGFMGNSGSPYEGAQAQLDKYYGQAQQVQQPFLNAGMQGLQNYQGYLNQFQHPVDFFNNIMNQYQASPFAQQQMQSGLNAGNIAASASGLLGSSNQMRASQDYARQITSTDQNQYLQNILGIGDRYGAGNQYLAGMGQTSANALTNLLAQLGDGSAYAAVGQGKGENSDQNSLISGAMGLASFL